MKDKLTNVYILIAIIFAVMFMVGCYYGSFGVIATSAIVSGFLLVFAFNRLN